MEEYEYPKVKTREGTVILMFKYSRFSFSKEKAKKIGERLIEASE